MNWSPKHLIAGSVGDAHRVAGFDEHAELIEGAGQLLGSDARNRERQEQADKEGARE